MKNTFINRVSDKEDGVFWLNIANTANITNSIFIDCRTSASSIIITNGNKIQ